MLVHTTVSSKNFVNVKKSVTTKFDCSNQNLTAATRQAVWEIQQLYEMKDEVLPEFQYILDWPIETVLQLKGNLMRCWINTYKSILTKRSYNTALTADWLLVGHGAPAGKFIITHPILQLAQPTNCNSNPGCVSPNLNSRSYPPSWRVWSGCDQLCHPLGCQWLPSGILGALRAP